MRLLGISAHEVTSINKIIVVSADDHRDVIIMSTCKERGSLKVRRSCCAVVTILMCLCTPVGAQETQFLPEVDAYYKLTPEIRISVQAKDTREGGEGTQAEVGPSVEFYLKPLISLKRITRYDLDDAKGRLLVVSAGYRYVASPTSATTQRIPLAATSHFPTIFELLLTDRSRADLDWSDRHFTWRYRNMLLVERTFTIFSYHLIPYASAEVYYESQYRKWSTTELYAGSLFPIGKHCEFTGYFEQQNNTGKSPNKQVHAVGVTLNLYISR